MPVRIILVPCWPGNAPDRQLDAAFAPARRMGAHVEMLFIRQDPALIAAMLLDAVAGADDLPERIERGSHDALHSALLQFEGWRERNCPPDTQHGGSVRSVFARWSERVGVPEQVVVHKGRLSDVIVMSVPEPAEAPGRVFDAAVFETGRPALLAPERVPGGLLRHIAIAWNGSLEATRAVAASLSLLHEAEAVTVFTTPGLVDAGSSGDLFPEDLDPVDAPGWHGVRTLRRRRGGGIGRCRAVRAACDHEAGLLVMGGFTLGRAAGAVRGDVTRHTLRNPAIPVLMAH